jgi:very-short-patch-repair endonuclease
LGKLQHGVLTRENLLEAGHTARSIGLRLASGFLEQLHPKVYGLGGSPDTWDKRLLAAYMWARPTGFVSHRSAGALYELDGVPPRAVELSLASSCTTPGVILHRVPPAELPRLRSIGLMRVSSVERTILDLAGVLPATRTGRSLDDALRKRLTTLERMWDELEVTGGKGKKGSRILRRLLSLRDDRDGSLESPLEKAALTLLRDPRLPRVTVQFVVSEAGANAPRLDFAYPAYLLGVEAHSYRFHSGHPAWSKDWARDNRLKLLGWTVLHYTWDEIHFEKARVVQEIRSMLIARGAQLR